MLPPYDTETGITETVTTVFSQYSFLNIIELICEKKIQGVLSWLDEKNLDPAHCLIIGSYLTGIRLANYLIHSTQVTVLDIYPHLRGFFHPDIRFVTDIKEIIKDEFDVIINTTGLGGITSQELALFHPPKAFIIEDPCSDGSDQYTRNISNLLSQMSIYPSSMCGIIKTDGLMTKTSGTMTLTLEVVKKSMKEVESKEGVLYSSSTLDFFERILFKDKNPDLFLEVLSKPALVASSLKNLDINYVIENVLSCINSRLLDRMC